MSTRYSIADLAGKYNSPQDFMDRFGLAALERAKCDVSTLEITEKFVLRDGVIRRAYVLEAEGPT